jgi:hypothetical protein
MSSLPKLSIEQELIDIDAALNNQTQEPIPDTVRSSLHDRRQQLLNALQQYSQ